ncbi:MAG: polyhydroxyalkanoate synthesis regulator DNA-binding domain-containing protein [Desulfopila sp.]
MSSPILFKKYSNRRLFNMIDRKYMTLSEIAELIRQGGEIQVREAKTNVDVTAFILTQIILEQGKNNGNLLPSPFLHAIIRYGDNTLNDFFENYFQQILDNYLEYRQAFDAQFMQWLDLGEKMTATNQQPLKSISPFFPFFDNDDKK